MSAQYLISSAVEFIGFTVSEGGDESNAGNTDLETHVLVSRSHMRAETKSVCGSDRGEMPTTRTISSCSN